MKDSAVIFSDELASRLGVSERTVHELARLGRLPFAVSSATPRRLCIDASHFNLWKEAAATACCET
jgi:excisionase family DNA binding protein